jgi:EAL domain-containing protein (putative c-di-GMP-specific phosphodiesterase class I)
MPFWSRRSDEERLFWARDDRFARGVADAATGSHVLDLDAGWCVIGPAAALDDAVVAGLADGRPYGLVAIDPAAPAPDRYLHALTNAVQQSGIADRIGMDQSPLIAAGKLLDYFFTLRSRHHVVFQPLVDLRTLRTAEWECLFRPEMPMLPQSITGIVDAAIATGRSVDLDLFIVERILARVGEIVARDPRRPLRLAINFAPASLLDPRFDPQTLATRVRAAGLSPRQVTLECTEQQAIPDVVRLKRAVRALRRLGFGVAVDDAGAGYASFTLIAALRPSAIKIDREIVQGSGRDVAKRALIEAFVGFARRIDARLVAEGIERRADLAVLVDAGVDLGQGYLLGRATPEPVEPPRRRTAAAFEAIRKLRSPEVAPFPAAVPALAPDGTG